GAQAAHGWERNAMDLLGAPRGNLFDLHATFRRSHEHRAAQLAVKDDAGVVLFGHAARLRDEDSTHRAAFGAGLGSYEAHSENLGSCCLELFHATADFHAPAFPSTSRMDLRFHHPRVAPELMGRGE